MYENLDEAKPYIGLGMGGVRDFLTAKIRETKQVELPSTIEEYIETRISIRSEQSHLVKMILTAVQNEHMKNKAKAAADSKNGGKKFLLLKARRMGFTTLEQAVSYATICCRKNVDVVTLAQDKESTSKIFRMVRMMHDYNPDQFRIGYDSKSEISYPQNNSSFFIGTAGSKAFGRGSTLSRVHGSEVAFWDLDMDRSENLIVGLTEACRQGEVLLETTANGAKGWFYETYVEAMYGKNAWTPLFYPWFADPVNKSELSAIDRDEIIDTLNEKEADMVQKYGLTVEQLHWRRWKIREMRRKFVQEYPSTWQEAFLIKGNTFFDSETILDLIPGCLDPIKESNNITIWKEPVPGKDYVIGMDTAGGGENGDFSVAAVLERETGEQVARLYGKWRPEVFARKSRDLGIMYNRALLAPEENNHGHSVINTLINTLNYRRIYYHLDNTTRDAKKQKKAGWQTTPRTRPVLLDELNEAIEDGHMIVNDKLFLEQCKIFVDNGSGKYEASKGGHDDLVLGWGIAWQARKQKRRGAILL